MKDIIDEIKEWNLEDQFDIVEREKVIKKLTSYNSDYAVSASSAPKLPSLEELKSYMHRHNYLPNIAGTLEAIKKLGNFA